MTVKKFDNEHRSDKEAALLHRMMRRGSLRFERLVERLGGTADVNWVANSLGITVKEVRDLVNQKELICFIGAGGEIEFPHFQFSLSDHQVTPGLHTFLVEVGEWNDKDIIRFLLVRYDPRHTDETPLDLLKRNQVAQALSLAEMLGEQRP